MFDGTLLFVRGLLIYIRRFTIQDVRNSTTGCLLPLLLLLGVTLPGIPLAIAKRSPGTYLAANGCRAAVIN